MTKTEKTPLSFLIIQGSWRTGRIDGDRFCDWLCHRSTYLGAY